MYHFILAVTDTQRMMTISSLNQILAANMLLSNFQAKRVNLIPKSYIFYNIAAMLRCGKLTLSRVQLSIVGNFNYTWPCLPVVLSLLWLHGAKYNSVISTPCRHFFKIFLLNLECFFKTYGIITGWKSTKSLVKNDIWLKILFEFSRQNCTFFKKEINV